MKKPFLSLLIVSIFLLSGCNSQAEVIPEIPAPVVETLSLNEYPTYQISELGQIMAVQEIELVAKAAGTIGQLTAMVGDPVISGQVLAVIDFDESNNPAQVNYDNANIQLMNARQNYDEAVANNQSSITQAELRVKSLENSLDRLKRNLDELYATNKSTQITLELQLENAEKNADTANVNYNNIVDQFDQSWLDLFKSAKTSLDGVFINLDTSFSTIENIINPNNAFHFYSGSMPTGLGDRDSRQRNKVANFYNTLKDELPRYQNNYEGYLPLNEDTLDSVIAEARKATDDMSVFTSLMRTLLQNSLIRGGLTQFKLDTYINQVGAIEGSVIGQTSAVDGLEKALASLKLSKTSQIATADNNRIIANNQFVNANTSLIQFQTTSIGNVQDLQTQITQTYNDLFSSQANLDSISRSAYIANNGKNLEINTLNNQLRLAEKSLTNNKITSSITGVLSEFVVDEGDYVAPGTYLGKVIQYEQVKVVFYVSKENADKLNLGKSFTFSIEEDSEEFIGMIAKISPSANPQNKKIKIEGSVQNSNLFLKPETFITLHLDISGETFDSTKVYVPMNSIIFAQNSQYVYVLENEQAIRRNIKVGKIHGIWMEVLDGLGKSDILIVDGQRNLPPDGGVDVQVIQ